MRLKRFASMLMCTAMVLCLLPLTIFGEESVTWALEGGVLTICGSGEMRFSQIPWADQLEEIQAIRLDAHITSIQDGAFSGCTELNSVILSQDLRYIGREAFRGCTRLNWVTLPSGLVGIGEEAFADCSNLRSVNIPSSVSRIGDRGFEPTILLIGWKDSASDDYIKDNGGYFSQTDFYTLADGSGSWDDLSWKLEKGKMTITGTGEIRGERLEDFPWDAYRGDITSLELNSGITALDSLAFAQCRKLTQVTIPDTVLEIGGDAFRKDCTLSGVTGSFAERYASENNLAFVPLPADISAENREEAGEESVIVEDAEAAEKSVSGEDSEIPQETEVIAEQTLVSEDASPEETLTAESQPEEKTVTLTLSVASISAQPGQQVRVPIFVSSNPGLCGLSFAIAYDKTILTLEDFETTGDLLRTSDWTMGIGEGEKALWLQPDAMAGNGEILTLVFKVAEGAPKGETSVELLEEVAVDEQANALALVAEPGVITIAAGIPGDVNGDGRVTQSDAKRLRRFLSGQEVAIQNGNADLNSDGIVNIIDLALLNKLVGKE